MKARPRSLLILIILVLVFFIAGAYGLGAARLLPAESRRAGGGTAEETSFAPSLRDESQPLPAPLTDTALPGPVCTLRREVSVTTAGGDTVLLPAGSPCYLLEAWADGLDHLLMNEWGSFYASGLDVDASGCGLVYEFSPDQDMRIPTCFSGDQLELCLSGGLSGLGEAFAAAEAAYGVNALFMIAICQHESANGQSGLATSQNNLIGLRSGSGWASFGSYAECVDYLGDYLAGYYLSPGCPFYHGSTIAGVSVTYCGGSGEWISHIGSYMQQDLACIQ